MVLHLLRMIDFYPSMNFNIIDFIFNHVQEIRVDFIDMHITYLINIVFKQTVIHPDYIVYLCAKFYLNSLSRFCVI